MLDAITILVASTPTRALLRQATGILNLRLVDTGFAPIDDRCLRKHKALALIKDVMSFSGA
ncbi:hypothetical protein CPTD_00687 [Corynebacterium pseudotuberculosis]|nr:hypothetical protein CPTA_00848 [Corynebacterium pseudotuberculosis]KEX88949.1 hypothetical protein CPTD_00687 [Corynebacterium pseudotuberculosis]